jgi:hypothetical protein
MKATVAAIACGIAAAGAHAEDLGQAIYFGRVSDLPTGRLGGIEQRGITCAGCHGRDAGGGGEGRSRIPAVHGAALGSVTADRPAYDAASFRRVVVEGRDSSGRSLSIAMPRFALSPTQADALWHYLKGIQERDRAGVSSDRVRIAIPASPVDDGAAREVLDSLSAQWAERGRPTIHGRQVEFVVVPLKGLALSTDVDLPFVLVAPVLDRDGKVLAVLRGAGVPVLAPRGALPADDLPADIVSVRAGSKEVAKALLGLVDDRTSIVADSPLLSEQAAGHAVLQPEAPVPPNVRKIVLLLSEAGLRTFVSTHRQAIARRTIVLPISLVEARPDLVSDLLATPANVVAARPAGDLADMAAYTSLLAQLLEKVLIEAGRDLTRTGFLEALRKARVRGKAWPEIDFQRHPKTGTV